MEDVSNLDASSYQLSAIVFVLCRVQLCVHMCGEFIKILEGTVLVYRVFLYICLKLQPPTAVQRSSCSGAVPTQCTLSKLPSTEDRELNVNLGLRGVPPVTAGGEDATFPCPALEVVIPTPWPSPAVADCNLKSSSSHIITNRCHNGVVLLTLWCPVVCCRVGHLSLAGWRLEQFIHAIELSLFYFPTYMYLK